MEVVVVPPNPHYTAEVIVLLTSFGVDRRQKRDGKLVIDLLETKRVHRKVIDMNMDARCGRDSGESLATERLTSRGELESWKLPQVFIDGFFVGDWVQLQQLEDDGALGRILRRQLCLKCHQPKDREDMTCPECGAEFQEVLPEHMLIEPELDRIFRDIYGGKYTEEDRENEDSDSGSEADLRFGAYVGAWWETFQDDPAYAAADAENGTSVEETIPVNVAEGDSNQQEEPGSDQQAGGQEASIERVERKESDDSGPLMVRMKSTKQGKLKMQQIKALMDDSRNPLKRDFVKNPRRFRGRQDKGSAAALLQNKKQDASSFFGMDREAQEKKANKIDISLVEEVVEWIEAITGLKQKDASFADWLRSGQVLCALANGIRPGVIKKVGTSSLPFKQMENITMFMNVARDWGVPESAMFGTVDLFEEKDLGAVVNCIFTFGGAVQVQCQDFDGPKLGVPLNVTAKTARRVKTQASQFGGYSSSIEGTGATKVIPLGMKEGTLNDDCVYGMDKDLKEKLEAKYDRQLEQQVTEWIEIVSGEKKGDRGVEEWLKDGRVLCALANAIRPGVIKKVHTSSLAFKQMENITFFTDVAREAGVPESAMFGTADLFEAKNLGSVINCIFTFGGAVQVRWPDFKGPMLGVPLNVESKSKRREVGRATDMSSGFHTALEVERPRDAKGPTAYHKR
mmetsp:Transcript_125995/g.245742  ORF Transcript_125995/g.245742 Transcript_125995/m.245742 type:complete len:683 (-) Transcript_125995:24-2072(-)